MRKILPILLLILLVFAAGCGKSHWVEVTPGGLTLTPGDSYTLSAVCSDGSEHELQWSSSDESVARVDANGVVTAVAQGRTVISATCPQGRQSAGECVVTVNVVQVILRSGVVGGGLKVGETVRVTATVMINDDPSIEQVTWSVSGDKAAADVSFSGNTATVTGRSVGDIELTAQYQSGGVKCGASCQIAVFSSVDYEMRLSDASLQMYPADQRALQGRVLAGGEEVGVPVTWSSANAEVARVDQNGLVTAVGPGSTVITASATPETGSRVTAPCLVTVNANEYSVEIRTQTPEKGLRAGEELQLKAVVWKNQEESDERVKWAVNDPAVASVNQDGLLTVLGPGTFTVTATYESPEGDDYKDTLQLEAAANSYEISLTSPAEKLREGDTLTLTATATQNGQPYDTELDWLSSDTGVLQVENGVVTGVAAGEASITVSFRIPMAEGGNTFEATVPLQVEANVYAFSITSGAESVWVGEPMPLSVAATKNGEAFSCDGVRYSVDNEQMGRVENGALIGMGPGTVTVTAAWTDPHGVTHEARLQVSLRSRYSITLEPDEITLRAGEEIQVVSETLETFDDGSVDDCYEGEVSWMSSDENAATVSGGVVKAFRPGATVTITAAWKAPDGSILAAYCIVTIEEPNNSGGDETPDTPRLFSAVTGGELQRSSIEGTDYVAELSVGGTLELVCGLTADAPFPSAVWSGSDDTVLSVLQNGMITAMGKGDAIVTVTVESGQVILLVKVN